MSTQYGMFDGPPVVNGKTHPMDDEKERQEWLAARRRWLQLASNPQTQSAVELGEELPPDHA